VEQANRVAVGATFFPLLDRAGAVGHVAIAFRDVTAEIQAREEVEAERDRLRLALEAGGMGIWDWLTAAGRLDWSKEVETLYGLVPGSFNGRYETFLGLIHPADRAAVSATIAEAAERGGDDFAVEHRVIRPDGGVRWLAGRGRTYLDAAGRVARMVGTVVDVTDRKAALAEREALLASEREARAEAEAALRARDEFLSVAAHELRTPVTGLRATVELLRRQQERGALDPDRLERHLTTIDRASRQLADLTTQLLDLSRLGAGQIPVDPRPTDLAALTGTVVEDYRDRLDGVGLRLIAEGPCAALADPGRVEQILANLIENARKYSPDGGEVCVSVQPVADAVEVRVQDAGIGLPPGAEERIFALFGRAPNAVARGIEGLGLGLYLCRRLAEAHGGTLHADSPGEGLGSTFTLRLPAAS
jgi:PAS domain S-box-containing protein